MMFKRHPNIKFPSSKLIILLKFTCYDALKNSYESEEKNSTLFVFAKLTKKRENNAFLKAWAQKLRSLKEWS